MLLLFSFKLYLNPRTQVLSSNFIEKDVSKKNTSITELKTSLMFLEILRKIKVVFCKERKNVCVAVMGPGLYFQNSADKARQRVFLNFNSN